MGDGGKDAAIFPSAYVSEFALEFVRRMRDHPDVPRQLEPSVRQAISIPSFLSGRFMRKGCLGLEDLVAAAVVTSYADNQEIARRVALEIIAGRLSRKRGPREDEKAGSPDGALGRMDAGLGIRVEGGAEKEEEGGGSGVGPGDDLFRDWIERFRCDKEYRRKVSGMADKILLKSLSNCGHTSLLKEDFGVFEGERLDYFQAGDDFDLIDFDESIQNIVTHRRRVSEVTYEDFIVRERRGQKKAVVFLEDISASMGEAIHFCKLFSVVLLYCLRKHELSLAFFESGPYVIKEFFEKKPLDEVIESVLATRTLFGTMGGNVMRWAREQLGRVEGRYFERVCIVLSDMGFFDMERVAEEMRSMRESGVKVILLLPPTLIYRSNVQAAMKARPEVVGIDGRSMESFSEAMSEVL